MSQVEVRLLALDTYVDQAQSEFPVKMKGTFRVRLPTGNITLEGAIKAKHIMPNVQDTGLLIWHKLVGQHSYLPVEVQDIRPNLRPVATPTTNYGQWPTTLNDVPTFDPNDL